MYICGSQVRLDRSKSWGYQDAFCLLLEAALLFTDDFEKCHKLRTW